jgi:hypothetical protein
MKRAEEAEARDVLADLQTILGGHPPPWLAKIIGVSARERVRFDSEYLAEEEVG